MVQDVIRDTALAGVGQPDAADLEVVACPHCGSDGEDVVYDRCPDRLHRIPGEFRVVRCTSCGLVRTNPRPSRVAIQAYYPSSYSPFAADERGTDGAYGLLRAAVRAPHRARFGDLESVPRPPRPGSRVLDIGCGAGLYLEQMAHEGWEPWGIEPNPTVAAGTAERLGIEPGRVFVGAAEDADFPPETFAFVAMSHVIEHLHDPAGVLRKVRRWLKPDGVVRIWTPNFGSLERRVFGRLWQGLDVPRHLTHFTPRTLGAVLEAAGFDVERVWPQWQGNMLTGSVSYAVDEARGVQRPYREPRRLHYALLPIASVLLACGEGGCMDVLARKSAREKSAAAP